MEMIEKAAYAILDELKRQADDRGSTVDDSATDDVLIDGRSFDLAKAARAAIEAMRDPTFEMRGQWQQRFVRGGTITEMWNAMIDEALADRPSSG